MQAIQNFVSLLPAQKLNFLKNKKYIFFTIKLSAPGSNYIYKIEIESERQLQHLYW